jgi:Flp pilus assembly protein TadG
MMTRSPFALMQCAGGTAAVEMALVAPMMIALMFGSFELGNYFLSEHVVVKAVRDGARYAGRLPFSEFDCANAANAARDDKIQNVVRTGQVADIDPDSPRLARWTNASEDKTITVNVACSATTTGGIYKNQAGGAPVVTVSASVPYSSLFGIVGLADPELMLNAEAKATVNGI